MISEELTGGLALVIVGSLDAGYSIKNAGYSIKNEATPRIVGLDVEKGVSHQQMGIYVRSTY